MAEHRAIKSTIWDDTWFGRLSSFEMNVWIGLFSKCADDQGRLQDDAALIRSKLFPYQDVAIATVEEALQKFNNGHLIRYEKGEHLAQLVRWFDNQPMQYAVPSNYPPPDGWIDRYRTNYKRINIVWNWNDMESTGIGILLWNGLSKLQRPSSWTSYLGRLNPNPNPNPIEKGNNRVVVPEQPQRPNIYKIYEQEIGPLSSMLADALDEVAKDFPETWFCDATREAKKSSTRVTLNYVVSIMKRWKAEGRSNGCAPSETHVPEKVMVDFGEGAEERQI
jgi:hypothetical protein